MRIKKATICEFGCLTCEAAPIPCPEYCTERAGSVFNTGVVSVVTEDGEVLAEADDPGRAYQIGIRVGRSKGRKKTTASGEQFGE